MIQMQITLPENVMEAIRNESARHGVTPNLLTRMRLCTLFLGNGDTAGKKSYALTLENWKEIEGYVEEKQLGSVEVFSGFAMRQYMSKYPRKEAQKRRVGENIGNAEIPR
jgi:hypothetical protein